MADILIVDDERAICEAFERLLKRDGHSPRSAATVAHAREAVREAVPHAVFLDVQLPDGNGLDLLTEFVAQWPELPVILMTARGSMETARTALNSGAFDYLGKPVEISHIRTLLDRALHQPMPALPASTETQPEQLVGASAAMQEVYKMISLLSGNDMTVLISGESGVGKELVAREIHAQSANAQSPFVAVNCAAVPEQLLESEFFGHEKGAFSGAHARRAGRFEAAANGTLFLDEVFELPTHLQTKLLRALEEKRFERVGSNQPVELRARIIAATNQPPVPGKHIREDLFYRLSMVTLNLPPLRDRREDIPALAAHFLARANANLGKSIGHIDEAAVSRLQAHDWPGNVRELANCIQRSALTARGSTLSAHDLALVTSLTQAADDTVGENPAIATAVRAALNTALAEHPEGDWPPNLYHTLINQAECALVEEALDLRDGNQVAASRLLGINRTTLRSKMRDR